MVVEVIELVQCLIVYLLIYLYCREENIYAKCCVRLRLFTKPIGPENVLINASALPDADILCFFYLFLSSIRI